MSRLYKPVVQLMNHLSFPKKFLLISVSFLMPMIYLAVQMFVVLQERRDSVITQLQGIPVYRATIEMLHVMEEHRDLATISRVNQQREFLHQITLSQQKVTEHLNELVLLYEQSTEAEVVTSIQEVQAKWQQALKSPFVMNGGLHQQYDLQSSTSRALGNIFYRIGEQFELSQSQVPAVGGVMSFIETDMREAQSVSSRIRSFGTYVLYSKNVDAEAWIKIDDVISEHEMLVSQLKLMRAVKVRDAALNSVEIEGLVAAYIKEFDLNLESLLIDVVEKDVLQRDWLDYYEGTSRVIRTGEQLEKALLSLVQTLLEIQLAEINTKFITVCIALSILLGIAIVMFVSVYRSITGSLDLFAQRAEQLADGDLSVTMKALSNDEMAAISKAFNAMANRLRENQQQLLHAEKMVSLGHLSAGMAHEINNPVGFVLSNVNTLREYISEIKGTFERIESCHQEILKIPELINGNKPVKELCDVVGDKELEYVMEDLDDLLKECSNGLTRVKSIVSALQQFANAEEAKRVPCHINTVIEALIMEKGDAFPKKMTVTLHLESTPYVMIDQQQLNQVLTGLLENSFEACEKEGEVTIYTTMREHMVRIEFCDNGKGISPDVMKKAFNPFFTTKVVGQGIGLGLSLCYRIIADHGGTIAFDPSYSGGAKIVIELPTCPS